MLLEPVNIIPSPIKSPYYVTSSLYSSLHGSKLEFNCDNSKVEDHMTSNFSSDLQKSDFGSPDMASHVMRFLNGLLQEAKAMVTEEVKPLILLIFLIFILNWCLMERVTCNIKNKFLGLQLDWTHWMTKLLNCKLTVWTNLFRDCWTVLYFIILTNLHLGEFPLLVC